MCRMTADFVEGRWRHLVLRYDTAHNNYPDMDKRLSVSGLNVITLI